MGSNIKNRELGRVLSRVESSRPQLSARTCFFFGGLFCLPPAMTLFLWLVTRGQTDMDPAQRMVSRSLSRGFGFVKNSSMGCRLCHAWGCAALALSL